MVIFLLCSLANRKNMDLLNDDEKNDFFPSIHSHLIYMNLNYNNNDKC